MTFEETRTKAEDLVGAVIGEERATAACDLVAHFENVEDLGELVAILEVA